jgi:hypothetical protein
MPRPLPAPSALQPPTSQQLSLPLVVLITPVATPPDAPPIPPCQVWASLNPTARAALHRALVRVLREVGHDADHA